jgi:hypothetical protein
VKDNEKIIIKKSYGSRNNNNNFLKNIGFNTIRIFLDVAIPCGFYEASTDNGPVTMIVGKENRNEAVVKFIHYKPELEKLERFEFRNLKRISNVSSNVINTFNIGCCS